LPSALCFPPLPAAAACERARSVDLYVERLRFCDEEEYDDDDDF
jgi:hypothetical protein